MILLGSTLFAGTASAIYLCADVLEQGNSGGNSGLKTFDQVWMVGEGQTLLVDLWVGDAPEPLLTAGVQILYDQSRLAVENVDAFDDSDLPGPWDYLMTRKTLNPRGPGYLYACGNLSGTPPDGCDDVLIARFTFRCEKPGQTLIRLKTIPDFDSVVGYSGTLYDSQMGIPPLSLFSPGPIAGMPGNVPGKPRNDDSSEFPVCIIAIE